MAHESDFHTHLKLYTHSHTTCKHTHTYNLLDHVLQNIDDYAHELIQFSKKLLTSCYSFLGLIFVHGMKNVFV